MRNIIDWSYVKPRLMGLALFAFVVWLGLPTVVRWALVSTGQQATGAKVDIEDVDISLLNTEFKIKQIGIANPKAPSENLFAAAETSLVFDRNELLKRRFVVVEGKVSGVQFNSDRTTSGAFQNSADQGSSMIGVGAIRVDARTWLKRVIGMLDVDSVVTEFESIKLAGSLVGHWTKEYESLTAQAIEIELQLGTIREFVENPRLNPISDGPEMKKAIDDALKLNQQLTKIRADLQRIRAEFAKHQQALADAKRSDFDAIDDLANFQELDADSMAEYLLGEKYGKTAVDVVRWVQWGRQYIPSEHEEIEAQRAGGETIAFPGAKKCPSFLVKKLTIDGEANLRGQKLSLAGSLHDLTSEPAVLGKPTVLKLTASGSANMQIEMVADRTKVTPLDAIQISCPRLPQNAETLGEENNFALNVSPGDLAVNIDARLVGDQLTGQVRLARESIELTSALPDKPAYALLQSRLNAATQNINSLNVVVDLSGTVKKPGWKIRSEFPKQMASAVSNVFGSELKIRRNQLKSSLSEKLDHQLAAVQQQISTQEKAVLAKLTTDENSVAAITNQVSNRLGLSLRNNDLVPEQLKKPIERISNLPSFGDIFSKDKK